MFVFIKYMYVLVLHSQRIYRVFSQPFDSHFSVIVWWIKKQYNLIDEEAKHLLTVASCIWPLSHGYRD